MTLDCLDRREISSNYSITSKLPGRKNSMPRFPIRSATLIMKVYFVEEEINCVMTSSLDLQLTTISCCIDLH